jgi:hypothetical protein
MTKDQSFAITMFLKDPSGFQSNPNLHIKSKEELIGKTVDDEESTLEVKSAYYNRDGALFVALSGTQKRKDLLLQRLDVVIEVSPDGNIYFSSVKTDTPKPPQKS